MIPITVWYILSRIGLLNMALFYFCNSFLSILIIIGELIWTWNSQYVFEVLLANILAYNLIKVVKFIINLGELKNEQNN